MAKYFIDSGRSSRTYFYKCLLDSGDTNIDISSSSIQDKSLFFFEYNQSDVESRTLRHLTYLSLFKYLWEIFDR